MGWFTRFLGGPETEDDSQKSPDALARPENSEVELHYAQGRDRLKGLFALPAFTQRAKDYLQTNNEDGVLLKALHEFAPDEFVRFSLEYTYSGLKTKARILELKGKGMSAADAQGEALQQVRAQLLKNLEKYSIHREFASVEALQTSEGRVALVDLFLNKKEQEKQRVGDAAIAVNDATGDVSAAVRGVIPDASLADPAEQFHETAA